MLGALHFIHVFDDGWCSGPGEDQGQGREEKRWLLIFVQAVVQQLFVEKSVLDFDKRVEDSAGVSCACPARYLLGSKRVSVHSLG